MRKFQKKACSMLLVCSMLLALGGCGKGTQDETQTSSQPAGTEQDASELSTGEENIGNETEDITETTTVAEPVVGVQTFAPDADHVKFLGRTYFDGNNLWMAHSASGAEFTFTGTKCSISVQGDSTLMSAGSQARIAVYVNGTRVVDDLVNKLTETYDVFESDTPEEVTVTVVKLSESAQSVCGITKIEVDGTEIAPTPEKDLKIEFIGDSITCGYGVDDEDRNHHFSTSTEDATRTYAYHTAALLDADYSFVSFSGYGIVSGYSDGTTQKADQTVSQYYSSLGFSYSTFGAQLTAKDIAWDHEAWQPDVIVINLGTNDSSWTKGQADRVAEFTEKYQEFLVQVREANPNAHIICALGIMGADLYPAIEDAVAQYIEATGDTAVSTLKFAAQQEADGIAADWHPTEATHKKAAEKLVEEIKKFF